MKALFAVVLLTSFPGLVRAEPMRKFPVGFKWCVATSAHQVEGDNLHSDWWQWERLPGKIKNGDRSGRAADEWNRLEEDARLISELNATQYRFSVEWAKIEPREGEWDLEALEHYRTEVGVLKAHGIEPLVTLLHFTLPNWLARKGGWEWSGTPAAFSRYARFVVGALAPEGVRDWITLNEPMVALAAGYVSGEFPPGKHYELHEVFPLMRAMLEAHAAAYHAMHAAAPGIRVGVAHHLRVFDPSHRWNEFDVFAARLLDRVFNWDFVMAIETGELEFDWPLHKTVRQGIRGLAGTQDFLGINYYSRDLVAVSLFTKGFISLGVKSDAPHSDLGWEIYPEGFYRVLKALHAHVPTKPILITENGIADHQDRLRSKFLVDHLSALHRAMGEGVPVESYCHWSLLDNFEWAQGFTPRFGLYAVDYGTFRRTPRPSARLFSEIAAQNGFDLQ